MSLPTTFAVHSLNICPYLHSADLLPHVSHVSRRIAATLDNGVSYQNNTFHRIPNHSRFHRVQRLILTGPSLLTSFVPFTMLRSLSLTVDSHECRLLVLACSQNAPLRLTLTELVLSMNIETILYNKYSKQEMMDPFTFPSLKRFQCKTFLGGVGRFLERHPTLEYAYISGTRIPDEYWKNPHFLPNIQEFVCPASRRHTAVELASRPMRVLEMNAMQDSLHEISQGLSGTTLEKLRLRGGFPTCWFPIDSRPLMKLTWLEIDFHHDEQVQQFANLVGAQAPNLTTMRLTASVNYIPDEIFDWTGLQKLSQLEHLTLSGGWLVADVGASVCLEHESEILWPRLKSLFLHRLSQDSGVVDGVDVWIQHATRWPCITNVELLAEENRTISFDIILEWISNLGNHCRQLRWLRITSNTKSGIRKISTTRFRTLLLKHKATSFDQLEGLSVRADAFTNRTTGPRAFINWLMGRAPVIQYLLLNLKQDYSVDKYVVRIPTLCGVFPEQLPKGRKATISNIASSHVDADRRWSYASVGHAAPPTPAHVKMLLS